MPWLFSSATFIFVIHIVSVIEATTYKGHEECYDFYLNAISNLNCYFFLSAKVGKTSLIMSLVSEEFPDEVTNLCSFI